MAMIDVMRELENRREKARLGGGQRRIDRAAGRRSAERHLLVVLYYYHYAQSPQARGGRARDGALGSAPRSPS